MSRTHTSKSIKIKILKEKFVGKKVQLICTLEFSMYWRLISHSVEYIKVAYIFVLAT